MRTAKRPIWSIWTRPRQTISLIVNEDPEYGVLAITVFSGISLTFMDMFLGAKDREIVLVVVLPLIMIAGPVRGLLSLYVGGWLLLLVGRRLGGSASPGELRAAIAWSNVPVAASCLGWFLLLAIFRDELFRSRLEQGGTLGYLSGGVVTAEAVLILWGYLILAVCLSTVQRFSLWKSIINLGVTALILWLPFWCFIAFYLVLDNGGSGG